MNKILAFFFLVCTSGGLKSQDFLSVPTSNPKLFHLKDNAETNEKTQVREDTFIYNYDTLELPFIDDFSVDHFPKRIESANNPRLTDTTVYRVEINGVVSRDTVGFTTDSTFMFEVNEFGQVLRRTPNQAVTAKVFDISVFPTTSSNFTLFPARNTYDTLNLGNDTVPTEILYKADSVTYYFVEEDGNDFYTDRAVYRNNTFAIDPPSIGVATFDGLDQYGLPYNIVDGISDRADELTSVPINLGNLPDENVYFSFFYQPKGLSLDGPEEEDSLVLEFYDVSRKKWGLIWDTTGFSGDSTFQQVIIRVPNNLHQNGFQFRFRNYANSSGAFDQWHVDYIYLNNGRTAGDTIYNDIAHVYDAPTILEEFQAMPWFHFQTNPADFMDDTAVTTMRNLSDENKSIFNKMVIPDTVNNTIFYRYPENDIKFVQLPKDTLFNFIHPVNFTYPVSAVDSAGTFKIPFDIYTPGSVQEPDFIRSNDTVIGCTVLENYYAYDDGTAEAGYGVNAELGPDGLTSYMAVEFDIPLNKDTIGGIDIYFLPQEFDIRAQSFEITVWNTLGPNGIIFQLPQKKKPRYSDENDFLRFHFDSIVEVNQTFYVGIKTIGQKSLNVGYDLNTNNKQRIFWSQDGVAWNNPSSGIFDGSLMIRPIFRKPSYGVGLNENRLSSDDVLIYPNPANDILNLRLTKERDIRGVFIQDLSGRVVYEGSFEKSTQLSNLSNGLYFIHLLDNKGDKVTKKFIIAR